MIKFAIAFLLCSIAAIAQELNASLYEIGTIDVQSVFVNPTNGDDSQSGNANAPLRTLREAWNRIPQNVTLTKGYVITLAAGTYNESDIPNYFEERRGTKEHPIIIKSERRGDVTIAGGFNIAYCNYVYLINLEFYAPNATADVVHFQFGNHLLLRNCSLVANLTTTQECLKLNQSQYVYVEDCNIQNAWDNAVDAVAVQYGHFIGNKIHHSGDWTMYLKGGSAYFVVEGNEFYNGGTGGFTAGQGTGFQFMTPPWLHYEAYDIKFVNNVIHHCDGAAFGVNGGYNILFAHNTAYRCGSRSHVFEAVFGSRSCDGDVGGDHDSCAVFIGYGGWGNTLVADGTNHTRIPNKNIFVYNNIIYNPSGYQSEYQHFDIHAAYSGEFQNGSNVAIPTRTDDNLVIKGNIIWNGPSSHELGIGSETGCSPDNPTCNETQLRADNAINTIEPQFVDAAMLNFIPQTGSTIYNAKTFAVPNFNGSDRPAKPATPNGNYANQLLHDANNNQRTTVVAGAIVAAKTVDIPQTIEPSSITASATQSSISLTIPETGTTRIHIYNIRGECVYSTTVEHAHSSTPIILPHTFSSGVYLLRITQLYNHRSTSVLIP